jgi:hypothetical protein
MKILVYAVAACLMLAVGAKGHGGGLDELGCHNDKRLDNYHCHRGPLAGRTFRSKAEAEREWDRLRLPRPAEKKQAK